MIGRLVVVAASLLISACQVDAAPQCNLFKMLDDEQQLVVEYSYARGKEIDMGYTLAAIALTESSAGKHRVNLKDPSSGSYHILVHTAATRLNVTDELGKLNLLHKIATDDVLGATLAILELSYWDTKHKGDWRKTVMSYNAGHKFWNGVNYLKKITYYVKELKQCKML